MKRALSILAAALLVAGCNPKTDDGSTGTQSGTGKGADTSSGATTGGGLGTSATAPTNSGVGSGAAGGSTSGAK